MGLILGSAVNQDGPTSGLTVPNGQAQQELLRQAHRNAQVEPWQVGYVEAHGTGTSLGDPIEAEALGAVFAAGNKRERPLLLGSVKTNLGHLEAAAGVAGLIKVVLGLHHGTIPGQLHLERLSEHVRWSELPLEVVTAARPWQPIEGRRIAGVSSFGFSGTNAHVVVEGVAQALSAETKARPAEVLVMTARTAPALRELVERYASFLEHSPAAWQDICHTAAMGRGLFAQRLAVAAESNTEAAQQLLAWLNSQNQSSVTGHDFSRAENGAKSIGLQPLADGLFPQPGKAEPVGAWISCGRVGAGERLRIALVLGSGLEALDALLGSELGHARSPAWESKWRSWGLDPVLVTLGGAGSEQKLAAVDVSLALVLGKAETSLPSVRVTGDGGWRELAQAMAELFVRGARIDWRAWEGGSKRHPVKLPSYPFQRERFWIEPRGDRRSLVGDPTNRSMLGRRLRAAGVQAQFETDMALQGRMSWIGEHVLQDYAVLPLTGHLELMLEAAAEVFGSGAVVVEDAVLQAPLIIRQKRAVQTVVAQASAGRSRVRIYAENTGTDNSHQGWQPVSEGWIRTATEPSPERLDLEAIRARLAEHKDMAGFYAGMAARGAEFGPMFRGLTSLWSGVDEALGEVRALADEDGYAFAPWRLDACLQIFAALLGDAGLYMPSSVGEIRIYGAPGERCWSYLRSRRIDSATIAADFTITDSEGAPIALFSDILFRKLSAGKADLASWIYRLDWRPSELAQAAQTEKAVAVKRVLVINEATQTGETAAQLRGKGAEVVAIEAGESLQSISQMLSASPGFDAAVLFVSSADTEQMLQPGQVTEQTGKPLRQLLSLAHELLSDSLAQTPRLYLVTRNACAAKEDAAPIRMLETPLVGLANALAMEAPDLRCTLIDRGSAAGEAAQIAAEVLAGSDELRIRIRAGQRQIARLERASAAELAAGKPMRLSMGAGIEALAYEPAERRELEPDEIEIAVRATALNFRDVLKATGVLEHAGPIGTDCAGVIARVGSAAGGFQVGEAVVAIAPGCFATHVVTAAALAVPKPDGLSFEEAAAQTVAYLTSDYCLNELGHMSKGQRVLIHAAAGGVGLAAVHLCQRAGVEVLATAGSEQKRAYLRSLGIKHVFDSRTLVFKDETTGGVDIVLNSLAGPAIDAGLSLLKPKGRFIELGKTDIRAAGAIRQQFPDVDYLLADLTPLFAERSPWIRSHLEALLREIAAGRLPSLPVTAFEAPEVKQAFRHMAAARHIGRVVVREGTRDLARGAHLITGGLRGIGLKLAEWLVQQGARDLVLVGRNAPGKAALQTIAQMEAQGATVRVFTGDIAELATAERAVRQAGGNLRGVWHCAGVIADAALAAQSWERLAAVMRPKVDGAWNLHTLTLGMDLEVFVSFSSLASLLGSRGQANYCAANAFLDGLAQLRRANGLPALTVNWGAWGETGLAAGEAMERQLARTGLTSMQPEDALEALKLALHTGQPQLAIAAIDWPKYLSQIPGSQKSSDKTDGFQADALKTGSIYAELILETELGKVLDKGHIPGASHSRQSAAQKATATVSRLAELNALPAAGRRPVLTRVLEEVARTTLDLRPSDEIDPDESLAELGMDSLLAVELRNGLSAVFERRLSSTLLFDYPTLRMLARFIEREVFPTAREETVQAAASVVGVTANSEADPLSILDEIERLSEEEVEASFAKGSHR